MTRIIKGRAWLVGDDINTDILNPVEYNLSPPNEAKKHVLEALRSDFAKEVSENDIIVAGRNFGCGSSRVTAAVAVKATGVGVVLADSMGRIFFRNSISIGLPTIICEGISSKVKDGDKLEVNLGTGEIRNLITREIIKAKPLPDFVIKIAEEGGMIEYVKKRLGQKKIFIQ